MDKNEMVGKWINEIGELWGRAIPEMAVEAYIEASLPFDMPTIAEACSRLLKESKRMPVPADFLEMLRACVPARKQIEESVERVSPETVAKIMAEFREKMGTKK